MSKPFWNPVGPSARQPRQVFKAKPVRSPHVARAIAAGKNMRHGLHGLGFAVNSFMGGMEDVKQQQWRQQQVDMAQAEKAKAEAAAIAQNNAMRTLAGDDAGYVDAGLGKEFLTQQLKDRQVEAKRLREQEAKAKEKGARAGLIGADGDKWTAAGLGKEKVKAQLRAKGQGKKPWWIKEDGSVDPAYLASRKAGATNVTTNVGKGQTEVDKKIAPGFIKYMFEGGRADTVNRISSLKSSIEQLRTTPGLTGLGPGVVAALGDTASDVLTPQTRQVRQDVETVIQRSLKEILGAQFAQKEGVQLMARAFNPALHPEVNARRAERIMKVLEAGVENKDKSYHHYQNNGMSMTGFKCQHRTKTRPFPGVKVGH